MKKVGLIGTAVSLFWISLLAFSQLSHAVEVTLVIKEKGRRINTMPPWRSRPVTDLLRDAAKELGPQSRSLGLTYRGAWVPGGVASARLSVEVTPEQLATLRQFFMQGPSRSAVTPSAQELEANEAKLFSDDWIDYNPTTVLELPLSQRIYAARGGKTFSRAVSEGWVAADVIAGKQRLTLGLQLSDYSHEILEDVLVDGKSLKAERCKKVL